MFWCERPSGCVISTSTSPQVSLPRRYDPQARATTPGWTDSAADFTCTGGQRFKSEKLFAEAQMDGQTDRHTSEHMKVQGSYKHGQYGE